MGFKWRTCTRRFRSAEAITTPDPPLAGGRTLAARGALWLSVGSWGAKGTQTLVLLVLAKALAPSEFGVLAIAALTYNVLGAINQLGIGDALTYLQDRIDDAARTALSMVLVAGLILMGATWALAPTIASFFHSPDATFVIRGFALGVPFDAAAQVPIGRLTRSLSFSRRAVTDTLPSVIGAAVTICIVIGGYPLIGLVAGQVTGSAANFAVAMLVGPRCLPGWSTVMARRLLRYGGFLSAADLVNLGLLNVDYIIVGHVLGPVALGYYSLAYRVCFMPYLSIALVANGAVFPYYCRLPSREDIARTAESTLSLITTLSIPWFASLVLFAGDIALLGGKWAPATGAVRFLAVYGLFLSFILSAIQVLKAVGRSDLVLLGRGLHLAILAPVLICTVRSGITVVALDQALVAGAMALVAGLWTVRHASLRPGALGRSVGLPSLGALGMVPVVLLLSRLPGLRATPSWTSLLILGPLALAVFAAISLAVMPVTLRKGWAALRGRPATGMDVAAQAGSRPAGKARRWRLPRPSAERTVDSMNSAQKKTERAAAAAGAAAAAYQDWNGEAVNSSCAIAFTVMTPTFNRAHTLPRAYSSLQDQTFRNFEWVVVDDGSTDHTSELINEWHVNSSFPIHYIRQANLGKHVARNRAVTAARGRFFVGLDSDDWLLPNALHRILEVWQEIPVERREDFLGVAGRCAHPDGTKIGNDLPTHFLDSDEIELRGRLCIIGDNAGMSRTDVLRAFPMPEFEGESFVTEGVVQNRIAQRYKTRYFDEVIKIADYQEGGLTDRSRLIRMQNASSSLVYYGELLAVSDRIGQRARLRASANFARYALHAGRPLWRTRGKNGIWTWLASLPAAVFLWAGDRRARRQTARSSDRHQ